MKDDDLLGEEKWKEIEQFSHQPIYTKDEKQVFGKKGKYYVTAVWEHVESRIIYADSKEEALERAKDDWDFIVDWRLDGFMFYDKVEKATNGKWKQLSLGDFS